MVDELLPHDYYHVNADEPPHKLQIVKPFFIVSSATPDDTYDIYKILSWSTESYKDIKSNSNVTYDKNKPITSDQQTRSRRAERSGVSFNSISKHPSFNALAVFTNLNSKLFDKEFDIGIYSLDLILYEKFINQFIQLSDDICRYLESNQLKIAFEQYELDRIYNRICAGGDDKIDDFYKQVKKIIDLMTLTKKIKFDKFLGRHGIKVVPWRSEWTYRLIKRFILQVNDEKSDHQLIFRELCKIFAGIKDEKLFRINYIDYLTLERADSSKHSKSLESIRGYLQPEQDKTLWVTEILFRIQLDYSNGRYGSNFANSINAYDKSEVQFSTRITKFINAVSSRRVLYDQVTEQSKGNPLGKFQVTNFVRVNVKSNVFECVKLYLFVEFKEGFTYSKDHDVFTTINDLIHSAFDKNFRGCNVTIEQSLKLNCLKSNVLYNHWAKVELKKSRSKQGNFINDFVNEIEMFQYLYYKEKAMPLVKSYTRGQIDNARNKQSKVK